MLAFIIVLLRFLINQFDGIKQFKATMKYITFSFWFVFVVGLRTISITYDTTSSFNLKKQFNRISFSKLSTFLLHIVTEYSKNEETTYQTMFYN